MLGYFNRFASDDYGLISLLNEYGVWGGMVAMYHGWSAMWATYLLLNPFMLFLIFAGNLVWYSVFIILLVVYTFYKLLQFFNHQFNLRLPFSIIFFYSFLLFASFYFLLFNGNYNFSGSLYIKRYTRLPCLDAGLFLCCCILFPDRICNWKYN